MSSRSDARRLPRLSPRRSRRAARPGTSAPSDLDPAGHSRSGLVAVARGTGLTLLGGVASVGFGFALTVIVTRGFGAEGAGVFFVATAIFAILTTLATFGADIGSVRMVSRYLALNRIGELGTVVVVAVFPVLALSTLLAGIAVSLSSELGGLFVQEDDAEDVSSALRILVPLLPFAAVTAVLMGATRGLGTMVPHFVTEQIGSPLARLIGVGVLVAAGADVAGALYTVGATIVLATIVSAIWLVRLLRRAERGRGRAERAPRVAAAVEFWRFASVRGLVSVPKVLVEWLDVILVGILTSAAEAGIYAAVTRLVRVGSLGQRATILAMSPRFSALFAVDDRAGVGELYRISTAWIVAFSFPVYLVLAFFSPTVVQVFGDDFSEGALVLTILALAMLVDMATGSVTTILLMAGKAGWVLGNTLGSLAINVTLNLLLIPTLGITGAAIAWSASILFQNLVPAFQIAHGFGVHPLGVGLVAAAGGAVATYGVAGLIGLFWSGVAAAFVLVGVATVAYGAIVWRYRDVLALSAIREAVRFRQPKASPAVGAG